MKSGLAHLRTGISMEDTGKGQKEQEDISLKSIVLFPGEFMILEV